jgi:hypothetical protein
VALAEAHWVDKTTLLWPAGEDKPIVRLYYSHSSKVAADSEGKFTDRYLKLTPTTVSQQVSMRFPQLSAMRPLNCRMMPKRMSCCRAKR